MKLFTQLLTLYSFVVINGFIAPSMPEKGHVGIYYYMNKLTKEIQRPGGLNFRFLLTTSFVSNIDVRSQVDHVMNVECGSAQGGTAIFNKISVHNQLVDSDECVYDVINRFGVNYDEKLIYSKIPHEVAQFCKNYPLEDIYIRKFNELDEVLIDKLKHHLVKQKVDKCLLIETITMERPKLNKELANQYDNIESEKKKLDLKNQEKLTKKAEYDILKQQAIAEQEKEKAVQELQLEKMKVKAQKEAEIQQIDNEKQYSKAKSESDAILYKQQKEAEAEQIKRNKEIESMKKEIDTLNGVNNFLEKERIKAHRDAKNLRTHWFAGDKESMPNILMPGMNMMDDPITKGDIKSNDNKDEKCMI